MQLVVIAEGAKQNEFHDKSIPEGIQVQLLTSLEDAHKADAYFYLLEEDTIEKNKAAVGQLGTIVFVNAVAHTLDQLPDNCVRLNAWPGFLLSESLELSATEANKPKAQTVLDALQWKYHFVPDIPGMITPRTVAMIVNEAYYALGDKVSTREDIDTAMKLGTGYPHGPFEWSEKIGLQRIHLLLTLLQSTDERYQPAPLITTEVNR